MHETPINQKHFVVFFSLFPRLYCFWLCVCTVYYYVNTTNFFTLLCVLFFSTCSWASLYSLFVFLFFGFFNSILFYRFMQVLNLNNLITEMNIYFFFHVNSEYTLCVLLCLGVSCRYCFSCNEILLVALYLSFKSSSLIFQLTLFIKPKSNFIFPYSTHSLSIVISN